MLVVVRARTCRGPGAGNPTATAARMVASTVRSVSHTEAVARIAGPLLGMLLLSGGATSSDEQLHAWTTSAPYLPPPSVTAQARGRAQPQALAPAPKGAAGKGPGAAPQGGVAQGAP